MSNNENPLADKMTPAEVATLLGVHVNTVRTWIQEGILPASRRRRRMFIARADALAFMEPYEPLDRPRPRTRREHEEHEAEIDAALRKFGVRK